MRAVLALAAALLSAAPVAAQHIRVERVATPGPATPLPVHIGGRVVADGQAIRRQWPGTYIETRFDGPAVQFDIGPGDVALHVTIDDSTPTRLVRPPPGTWRIAGLAPGAHRLRVEVVSESQSAATVLGTVTAPAGTKALPLPHRPRQIEFIGDSHTVGYGNTSKTTDCTQDMVWATTDTSRGIAALTAARYDADYQVNAISGRGIVRNYANGPGATLPAAYPFALLDRAIAYSDPAWRPSVIVIGLGTNDFSTPLGANEPWKTRDALQSDYVATYARFVRTLRAQNPRASFILWATDLAGGEIATQAAKVVDRLRATGERRATFVPVPKLTFAGCHFHPDLADDRRIADALGKAIDASAAFQSASR